MRFQRRKVGRCTLLGVAAAILLVAMAVPVVARRPEPFVTDIEFADPRHGFALRT